MLLIFMKLTDSMIQIGISESTYDNNPDYIGPPERWMFSPTFSIPLTTSFTLRHFKEDKGYLFCSVLQTLKNSIGAVIAVSALLRNQYAWICCFVLTHCPNLSTNPTRITKFFPYWPMRPGFTLKQSLSKPHCTMELVPLRTPLP